MSLTIPLSPSLALRRLPMVESRSRWVLRLGARFHRPSSAPPSSLPLTLSCPSLSEPGKDGRRDLLQDREQQLRDLWLEFHLALRRSSFDVLASTVRSGIQELTTLCSPSFSGPTDLSYRHRLRRFRQHLPHRRPARNGNRAHMVALRRRGDVLDPLGRHLVHGQHLGRARTDGDCDGRKDVCQHGHHLRALQAAELHPA